MKFFERTIFRNLKNLCPYKPSRNTTYPSINSTNNRGWKFDSTFYIGVPAFLSISYLSYTSLKSKSYCNGFNKVELGNLSDFKDGESKQVKVYNGKDTVLVSKIKGNFYVTGSSCPHFSASFIDGAVTDELLICPWHNAKFKLSDGSCVNGPCMDGIATYEPVVQGDKLYALLPPTPLPLEVEMLRDKTNGRDNRVFVICGGGASAHAAAETLRLKGFTGRILMYADEKYLPYYRPYLSKAFSKEYDKVPDQQALRSKEFYKNNQIEFYSGKSVRLVNDKDHTVTLSDGTTVKYDKVLVATGNFSARLPVSQNKDYDNLFTVRTIDDLKSLSKFVKPNANIVIVGANFIGCELSSVLKSTGANVTVLTNTETPLETIVGKRVGGVVAKLMEKNGVKFLPKCTVKKYNLNGNKINEVVLDNNTTLKADAVIEGVGTRVDTSLLPCAQLAKNGTVLVDEAFRCKGCKDVFASGDLVSYPYHRTGKPISVKHWNVALQHGRVAASNMVGKPAKMDMIPFFWSNFFKTGFRFAGVIDGTEELVFEGDVDSNKFTVYYVKDKNVVAVLAMGMDKFSSYMTEAFDKKCMPSYAALKMGAANSQSIIECVNKFKA
ncbi:Pyridine nucleotide-disulfide oxidoreductase family protein [Theileria parva strain Muguga]|uniref:Pyridine nucleotide-disulfide oxidoreductase family protein n=1 Tax=Theileria parva strain Muguga TaxID=333668 RepID=UPI001C6230B1|nr:Pyridine nucleotide-disulfide oxidoreductase family protein [Theileria parva strain Muguga]EAN30513.2 Pyridine nucleotide-disulfide oxidoreductase family protein [Theileria parva strain Muguga]